MVCLFTGRVKLSFDFWRFNVQPQQFNFLASSTFSTTKLIRPSFS